MIPKHLLGFALIGVGLPVSVLGMLSFTGLIGIGIPTLFMILGFILAISGLVFLYADLKENEVLVAQYLEEEERQRRKTCRSSRKN